MKVVKYKAVVDSEKCTGDKRCEALCPAGAIRVVKKKADVSINRCVACGKCVDTCKEDAVRLVRRDTPMTIGIDTRDVDAEKIQRLCTAAALMPEILVCACTGTSAGEIAAAIISGAASPEDIVTMTGAGSGCGIYCMGVIFKLFRAAGIDIPDDRRWHQLPLSPADIPENIVNKYPEYHFRGSV
ncbi:MAG: (2Fe-2S)-binding protein [Desulfobacterales bacterium]